MTRSTPRRGRCSPDDPGSVSNITASMGATESGTTVTITTTAANTFQVGQTVTIAGVSNAGYNGTFVITSVNVVLNQITYTDTATLLPNAAGGTATVFSGLLIANQTLQVYGPGIVPAGVDPSLYNHAGNTVWAGDIPVPGRQLHRP